MTLKPFKYQRETLDEIDEFGGRSLVGHQMGLGKTLITLWWMKRHRKEAFPALVVCPASLKLMWAHEARSILGIEPLVLQGRKAHEDKIGWSEKFVVINYEVLQNWKEVLDDYQFQTLVLEECQYCKSHTTKRTKAAKYLARHIPYVLALSGTPMLNRPIELHPVLDMISPKTFGTRFNFGKKFCAGRLGPWGWEFKGATHTDELHALLKKTCMTRRLKSEVLKDLPPKNRFVVPVPMRNPEEYEEAQDNFLEWLEKKDSTKAALAKEAEAVVQLGYLKRLAARLKAKYVVRWINKWLKDSNGDKLVLFAEHRGMLGVLEKRCKAKSVVLEGRTSMKRRNERVEQFQNDPETRLFIANRQVGGTGFTLTAASTVVFTEFDWVPANLIQAEDRIHRIGQTRKALIYYFVAMGTIEESLCGIIQSKQRTFDAVLDGGKMDDSMDIYNQLLEEYKNGS